MQLYLVQHGAAKSEAEDPQRSLTTEGRLTVERLADFLVPLQLSLDRIEHSEKLRAKQTAEILAERLRPREGTKEIRGMAPKDNIEAMCSTLQGESKNLMLVGHLPYLARTFGGKAPGSAGRPRRGAVSNGWFGAARPTGDGPLGGALDDHA